MIATILPGSTNFHAVGYNEHKVSKGVARLIEIQNFGSLGTFHKPTPSELVSYLQKYSSQNSMSTVTTTPGMLTRILARASAVTYGLFRLSKLRLTSEDYFTYSQNV